MPSYSEGQLTVEKESPQLIIETETFEREHAKLWNSNPNEFVLIFRDHVIGCFPTSRDAETAGYLHPDIGFDRPFLVKQILEDPRGEVDTYNLATIVELAD